MTRTFSIPSGMPFWPQIRRRPLISIFCVLLVISFGLFTRPTAFSDLVPVKDDVHYEPGKYWTSFADVSTLFVFGDSWSSLGFKICPYYTEEDAYHFGNPEFPGVTTTNGPNWIGYLAHVFNRSVISEYNLAIPGTAVEGTIVAGFAGWDFKTALGHLIDPANHCQWVPETWDPATTLFTVFFGMNDIVGCVKSDGCDIYKPPIAKIFESYTKSIAALHAAGARNFVLLNAPPVDPLSALDLRSNPPLAKAQAKATKLFNKHHRQMVQNLRKNFADTTVFDFDVWGLFQQIYHNLQSVPDAAIYRNLTDMCPTYGPFQWPNGTEVTQAEIDLCGGLRPEEYLWNSGAHVTWPAHKAIARGVVDLMDMYNRSTAQEEK